MERVDIAIIGTGPAGLEAAVTAKIRNKTLLLIGNKDFSSKLVKAELIRNYLGLADISGRDLADHFQEHLDKLEIEITEDKITAVYSMGDYFALQNSKNEFYEARTIILATGVMQGKLYPGEEEFLGRGVSYCATCDAPLYHGKTAVVVGSSEKEEEEADFLAEVADKVFYIPTYKGDVQVKDSIEVVREKPKAIFEDEGKRVLKTDGGAYPVDGIFILRESVSPAQLVPGLETDKNHVKVDRTMATNIPGCFACGDIVGKPYQYIKAAGEGNIAALSAVGYLAEKKRQEEKKRKEEEERNRGK